MRWLKVKIFEIIKEHSDLLQGDLKNNHSLLATYIDTIIDSCSIKLQYQLHLPYYVRKKDDCSLHIAVHLIIYVKRFFEEQSRVFRNERSIIFKMRFLIDRVKLVSYLSVAILIASKYSEDKVLWNRELVHTLSINDLSQVLYFQLDIPTLGRSEVEFLSRLNYQLHVSSGEARELMIKEADYLHGDLSFIQHKHLMKRVGFFKDSFEKTLARPRTFKKFAFDLETSQVTLFNPLPTNMPKISRRVEVLLDKPVPMLPKKHVEKTKVSIKAAEPIPPPSSPIAPPASPIAPPSSPVSPPSSSVTTASPAPTGSDVSSPRLLLSPQKTKKLSTPTIKRRF